LFFENAQGSQDNELIQKVFTLANTSVQVSFLLNSSFLEITTSQNGLTVGWHP
jgi:hypothetical protein